jgi:hypothetical protein
MVANGSGKAFCVRPFHGCRLVTIFQLQYRTKFGKQPSYYNSIRRWYIQFQETGFVCKKNSPAIENIIADMLQKYSISVLMFVEQEMSHV